MSDYMIVLGVLLVTMFIVILPLLFLFSQRGKVELRLPGGALEVQFDKGGHAEFNQAKPPVSRIHGARYWITVAGTKHNFRLDSRFSMKIMKKSENQYTISQKQSAGQVVAEFYWQGENWHVRLISPHETLFVNDKREHAKKLGNGNQIVIGRLRLVFQDFGPSGRRSRPDQGGQQARWASRRKEVSANSGSKGRSRV